MKRELKESKLNPAIFQHEMQLIEILSLLAEWRDRESRSRQSSSSNETLKILLALIKKFEKKLEKLTKERLASHSKRLENKADAKVLCVTSFEELRTAVIKKLRAPSLPEKFLVRMEVTQFDCQLLETSKNLEIKNARLVGILSDDRLALCVASAEAYLGYLVFWDMRRQKSIEVQGMYVKHTLTLLPDGNVVGTSKKLGRLTVCDSKNYQVRELKNMPSFDELFDEFIVLPNGYLLLSKKEKEGKKLYATLTTVDTTIDSIKTVVKLPLPLTKFFRINNLKITPDGHVVGIFGDNLMVWDIKNWQCVRMIPFAGDNESLRCFVVTPQNRIVGTINRSETSYFKSWDLNGTDEQSSILKYRVGRLKVLPNGYVACYEMDFDGSFEVRHSTTGTPVITLNDPFISEGLLSPNGDLWSLHKNRLYRRLISITKEPSPREFEVNTSFLSALCAGKPQVYVTKIWSLSHPKYIFHIQTATPNPELKALATFVNLCCSDVKLTMGITPTALTIYHIAGKLYNILERLFEALNIPIAEFAASFSEPPSDAPPFPSPALLNFRSALRALEPEVKVSEEKISITTQPAESELGALATLIGALYPNQKLIINIRPASLTMMCLDGALRTRLKDFLCQLILEKVMMTKGIDFSSLTALIDSGGSLYSPMSAAVVRATQPLLPESAAPKTAPEVKTVSPLDGLTALITRPGGLYASPASPAVVPDVPPLSLHSGATSASSSSSSSLKRRFSSP